VAAVLAADPYSAEDIAELVVPKIEPLAPCLDPVESRGRPSATDQRSGQ
jgi:CO/xanthine dehydrogenase Mo-binding subunit